MSVELTLSGGRLELQRGILLTLARSWGIATATICPHCLSEGGEMGALMRSTDWSKTLLGPVAGWPASLRTSISICLNSRFPILLLWGPELIMLYNDAYRPMLGATKHPAAMGQRGRECWPEIWEIIGPMLEGVLYHGQATWSEDLLLILERNGLRLAFLGYVNVPEERDGFDPRAWTATTDHFGVAWADSQEMAVDIRKARTEADVVIVLLHSGFEIGEYMSTLSGDQREAAHAAIDAGAAVVIGSHPHQLEAIELYHGGLIAYSLGNFVFDDYRGIANASIILQVRLDRNGFQGYTYVPVLIDNGLPHVISDEQVPAIGTLVAPMPTVEK